MTAHGLWQLRVDIVDYSSSAKYALYDDFYIDVSANNFSLSIGTYSGTAGKGYLLEFDLNND